MEYRQLGKTGLKVSELCLGSMQFEWTATEDQSYAILSAAYEAGINFIDTADIYSRWVDGNSGGVAEEIIGKWWLKAGIPRDRIVIATKVRGAMGAGPNAEGLSRAHIFNAVHASLQRLNTDFIDMYQAHWFDASTPIEETLQAFDDLVSQGKVRYIGCSNYPAWRLTEALWAAKHFHLASYCSLQPHYNLVHRSEFEGDLAEVCQRYGLGVIPYSPLAGGFLTGKYRRQQIPDSARASRARRYFNERNWQLLDLMKSIGQELGKRSLSQIALAWLLSQPGITSPIIGPRNLEQLDDNIGAIELRLDPEIVEKLDRASSDSGENS